LVVSATDVAVNVTVAGFGIAAGPVNVTAAPEALEAGATAPHVAALQPVPVTTQVTPLFAESFATVAVNAWVPLTTTLAVVKDNVTDTGAAPVVNVILVVADFVASATDVAVSMTVPGLGIVAGAVYVTGVPEALDAGATVPHVAPLQPMPESAQVTPLLAESFATVAISACVAPTGTLTVGRDIVTVIALGVGVPPPPPLLETDPEQPEISEIAKSVTRTLERDSRPVPNGFTENLPKMTIYIFLELSCPGGWSKLFVPAQDTNAPWCLELHAEE
jgi:hypothetical protein